MQLTTAALQVGDTAWRVSPFVTLEVDVAALAGQTGLLRFEVPAEPLSCFPAHTLKGGVVLLNDRIDVL